MMISVMMMMTTAGDPTGGEQLCLLCLWQWSGFTLIWSVYSPDNDFFDQFFIDLTMISLISWLIWQWWCWWRQWWRQWWWRCMPKYFSMWCWPGLTCPLFQLSPFLNFLLPSNTSKFTFLWTPYFGWHNMWTTPYIPCIWREGKWFGQQQQHQSQNSSSSNNSILEKTSRCSIFFHITSLSLFTKSFDQKVTKKIFV